MASGLRFVRRAAGWLVFATVLLSVLGYVVYATNGILDEVEARDTREQHDKLIVSTATALAQRLVAVANGDISPLVEGDTNVGGESEPGGGEAVAGRSISRGDGSLVPRQRGFDSFPPRTHRPAW